MKMQRVIFVILTLTTFIMIYIFSSQNANMSSNTSKGFTRKVIEILRLDKNMSPRDKNILIENCQHIVRKLAHFTIYTFLGISIFGFINTFDTKKKNKILGAFLVGICYAILDEFHQMFSDGRTPALKDVFIDSFGILFGIALFFAYIKVMNKVKTRTVTIHSHI